MKYILSDKQAEGCVFCAKAATPDNDYAAHVIARSARSMLLLNIYPYNNGHLMVVPYAHVGSLTALDDAQLADMMRLTRLAEAALRQALSPQGFNVGINIGKVSGAGMEDHIHIHIVPRWAGDTNFMSVINQTRTIPELLDETRDRLGRALGELGLPRDPKTGVALVDEAS